jgi:hypothetical protein
MWVPLVTELSTDGPNRSPEKKTRPSFDDFFQDSRASLHHLSKLSDIDGVRRDSFCGRTLYASLKCRIEMEDIADLCQPTHETDSVLICDHSGNKSVCLSLL